MALYRYVKKQNKKSLLARLPSPRASKQKVPRKFLVLFSVLFFFTGLFLIGQVAYPLAGWYLFTLPGYNAKVNSPLASKFETRTEVYAATTTLPALAPKSGDSSYDVKSWFVGTKTDSPTLGSTGLKIYNLSIPKIGIDQATVEVGGTDLKKYLVGWPTSPLPGRFGNNIVFGHSELAQFASPKDYAGIFTHIMDLAVGDEIFVDYDGIRYKYEVFDKFVVEPTDLSVLEQRFDSAYITLITCVPPGTVWQRGIVRGRLVEI